MKSKEAFSISDFRFATENQNPARGSIANRQSPIASSFAFTLIEVLIAITIFTMVMAAIYSTWFMIVRASRVAQEAAAQAQRERIAIHTIENSLTQIQSFQASMQYYTFTVQNGDQPLLSFTARLPDDFPRSGRFGDFNVRQLTYSLEPVADAANNTSENDLVLRQYPILEGMDPDEQANPYVLARNVQTFAVECWDTNAQDWTDEWDDTNSIPPLIRISLVFGAKKDNSPNPAPGLAVTRVIAIPSQTMPASSQVPGLGGGGGAGTGINLNGNGGGGGGRGGGGTRNGQNGGGQGSNYPNGPNSGGNRRGGQQ